MKSPYDTLQVSQHATQAEIKSAYRTLAKKYHPDVNKAPNASVLFGHLNTAFETLKNTKTNAKPLPKKSASNAPLKLYVILSMGQTIATIRSGYPKVPAGTWIFLMINNQEHRLQIKEERTTPFSLIMANPKITLTVTE